MRWVKSFLRNACSASSRSLGLSSTSSTSTGSSGIVLAAEGEIERRAPPGRRLRPHAAAVAANDALDDREPHAGALVVLRPMQPLKDSEQLAGVLHVETHAVVLHVVGGGFVGAVAAAGADLDRRVVALAGELE